MRCRERCRSCRWLEKASISSRIWARSAFLQRVDDAGGQHLVQDTSIADVIGRVDSQRDQWDGTAQLVEGPRRGEDVRGSDGRTAPPRDSSRYHVPSASWKTSPAWRTNRQPAVRSRCIGASEKRNEPVVTVMLRSLSPSDRIATDDRVR